MTIGYSGLEDLLSRAAKEIPAEKMASLIDHTLLKPTSRLDDVLRVIEETQRYGFRCAIIPPSLVYRAKSYASETGVDLCTVVGFPAGFAPAEAKREEANIIAEYVSEADIVAPLWAAVEGDYGYVKEELAALVETLREGGVKIVKIIVEAPLVDDNTLHILVKASKEAGADFVKTSTGVYSKGGDPNTVLRLYTAAKPYGLRVKAAGGIRTGIDALLAIISGAERIGTSSGPKVIESYRRLIGEQG